MARNSCVWILGRGASIANGLSWHVPHDWYDKLICGAVCRNQVIDWIKETLKSEMDKATVHNDVYRRFVDELSTRTANGWYHRFLTTNWDTLLEKKLHREVDDYHAAHDETPSWIGKQSWVFHLNGTIEDLPPPASGDDLSSKFLLEIDPEHLRVKNINIEVKKAFSGLIWTKYIIIVGMSFGCPTDRSFLNALNRIHDLLPIGEAKILIVNPDPAALAAVRERVQTALPASDVIPIEEGFDTFVRGGLAPLNGPVLTTSSWWCRLISFILK